MRVITFCFIFSLTFHLYADTATTTKQILRKLPSNVATFNIKQVRSIRNNIGGAKVEYIARVSPRSSKDIAIVNLKTHLSSGINKSKQQYFVKKVFIDLKRKLTLKRAKAGYKNMKFRPALIRTFRDKSGKTVKVFYQQISYNVKSKVTRKMVPMALHVYSLAIKNYILDVQVSSEGKAAQAKIRANQFYKTLLRKL